MGDFDFNRILMQTLVFVVTAGSVLFLLARGLLTRGARPITRFWTIVPAIVLLTLTAYGTTHSSHVTLQTLSGCGAGIALAVVFIADRARKG